MGAGTTEVAVIAGGADSVGEYIGLNFGKRGVKVVIVDNVDEKVNGLVARIKDAGGEARGVVADPTSPEDVKRAVEVIIEDFTKIDILINNVDEMIDKGSADLTDHDWSRLIAVNLNPAFFFCREILPKMRENKYGRIINMSSLYYLGWPGKVAYSASKSAIFGFTRSLALEVAKNDITVNTVAVGDLSRPGLSEEDTEKMAKSIPVMRLAEPDDVANAVGFLSSQSAKYVTGQTLFVCGGKSIHFSMSI